MTEHLPLLRGVSASIFFLLGSLAFAEPHEPLPVPSRVSQQLSAQRIREIFSSDFSKARTPKEQATLAEALIGHSRDTQDASDAFALLETARSLSITAGDLNVANRAINELAGRYRVDAAAMKIKTLEEIAARGNGPTLGPVVDALVAAAVQAAGAGGTTAAEDLLKTAAIAARKCRDKQRQDAVLNELKRIREQTKAAEKITPLVKRLETDPSDRQAAALLGKHRCFTEGDWEAGLPLLARGDDAALAQLAVAELRPTGNAMALGDAWWAYADTLKGQERTQAAARAVGHYRSGLEKLSGLDKIRVEKRIADAEHELANMPGLTSATRPHGTVFWLDATATGTIFNLEGKPAKSRAVDPQHVGIWKDAQVPSLTASATGQGSAPLFVAGAIGGNPGIEFRGKQLLLAKGPLPQVGSLMIVAQCSAPVQGGCLLGSASGPPVLDTWARHDGALWFTMFPRKGEMKRFNTDPNVFQPGEPFLLTVSWPKPFVFRVNGKQKTSRTDIPPDVLGTNQFVIGAHDSGLRYPFSGHVGEVLVLDKALPPDDLAKLETALMQKWRIRP